MKEKDFRCENIPIAVKAENDYFAAKKLLAISCQIAKYIAKKFPDPPAAAIDIIDYYAAGGNGYRKQEMGELARALKTVAAYNARKPYNAFRDRYHGRWYESMRRECDDLEWQIYRETQFFDIIASIAEMAEEIASGKLKDAVATFELSILIPAPATLLRLEHQKYIDPKTTLRMMDECRDRVWKLIH